MNPDSVAPEPGLITTMLSPCKLEAETPGKPMQSKKKVKGIQLETFQIKRTEVLGWPISVEDEQALLMNWVYSCSSCSDPE